MAKEKNYTFLRRVGYAEAASYLILLLIAMPMKYGMGVD
jgi:hypothetical protein